VDSPLLALGLFTASLFENPGHRAAGCLWCRQLAERLHGRPQRLKVRRAGRTGGKMPVDTISDGLTEGIVQVVGEMSSHEVVGKVNNPSAPLGCWLRGTARRRRDTLVGPGHNAPPGRTA
jgi:hypothetical protein